MIVLYIFGGLPATGKSTLARHVAKVSRAVYLRIDTIEEAIEDTGTFGGVEGYEVAYRLAADNLKNGLSVVADSVNPIAVTRQAWRDVASRTGVEYREIEIVCTDTAEHRSRLELRSARGLSKRALSWEDVVNREYETCSGSMVFDTAGKSIEESRAEFEKQIF